MHIQSNHTRQASSVCLACYFVLPVSYPSLFHLYYSSCTPPHENQGGFILPIIIEPYHSFVNDVNRTLPCSVLVFIATILVDFTIVPDFNVQLSPIKQYGSTTTLAPMTVACPIVLPQPTTALGSTIQPGIKLADGEIVESI